MAFDFSKATKVMIPVNGQQKEAVKITDSQGRVIWQAVRDLQKLELSNQKGGRLKDSYWRFDIYNPNPVEVECIVHFIIQSENNTTNEVQQNIIVGARGNATFSSILVYGEKYLPVGRYYELSAPGWKGIENGRIDPR